MACRETDLIMIHCLATHVDRCFTEYDLEAARRRWGFSERGYHSHIRRNGDIKTVHPVRRVEAYARGCNTCSIGICYEGGLGEKRRPADTRTGWQRRSLCVPVCTLLLDYPSCYICGRRGLSPDLNENGETEPEEWVK